ncbi:hypothetical protein ACIBJF_51360 [Streptomyces sp. NPDC050743]|uniref:hypothetical protein n=1 Tax=Streptomyces sp. NPDC050743 TaxID=3365634 RepID=UPI0037A646E8
MKSSLYSNRGDSESAGDRSGAEAGVQAIKEPAGSVTSGLRTPAATVGEEEPEGQDEESAPAAAAEQAPTDAAAQPTGEPPARELPSIPGGAEGDRWFRAESNLVSARPNFKQAVR